MRSLITGVGGFAGQHLAARLLASSEGPVYGVARRAVGWHRPGLCGHEDFHLLSADLVSGADARRVVNEVRPDRAYLLAASSSPAEAFRDPLGTIHNNVACLVNVLEAIREQAPEARILVVSSAEVYGRCQLEDRPIAEEAPLAPDNPYAVSKTAQDLLAYQYYAAYGLSVVRVRPFNHIGPGQSERFVAASFAKQIAEAEGGLRDPIIEVGNLETCRDLTDVRDVVRGYELALALGGPGEVYNLASGSGVLIGSLLDGLVARSRVAIGVRVDPERFRPSDAPALIGDSSRFRQRTGWVPEIPLEQTLDDILADWRKRVAAR